MYKLGDGSAQSEARQANIPKSRERIVELMEIPKVDAAPILEITPELAAPG